MKLFLRILLILLTWFANLANATPVFSKVALPSHTIYFRKSENQKLESELKNSVSNFARSDISENSFSQKAIFGESSVLENRAREVNIQVVSTAGDFFKPLDELYAQFSSIIGNKGLKHIFRGEINSVGRAGGVHHISAVRAGSAQIVSNTIEDLGNGFYKAQVKVLNEQGEWVLKINPTTNLPESSTFFPDAWDEIKVMQEIQSAANNRVGDFIENTSSYQKYFGASSGGYRIYIVRTPQYNNNIFTSWFEPL